MTTVPEHHYVAAQYYAGLGLLPIPSEHGSKKMRLDFCDSCKDRMRREKELGRQAQYKKCGSCQKLKDITTPTAALAHSHRTGSCIRTTSACCVTPKSWWWTWTCRTTG